MSCEDRQINHLKTDGGRGPFDATRHPAAAANSRTSLQAGVTTETLKIEARLDPLKWCLQTAGQKKVKVRRNKDICKILRAGNRV